MNVPILDLQQEIDFLWDELNQSIQDVLRSTQFIMGRAVHQLEEELAAYLNIKHVVTLNSGTDALLIALRALGIKHGDEVITTPFTFFATAEAISLLGAIPIFVDIDTKSFNLDTNLLEAAITVRTKAILPVHLFGQATEMQQLMEVANRHNIPVLEDVAQAFGACYEGRYLGTIGQVGAFSFFPSKNLGAYGDGGMLATNDDSIAELAAKLRTHGSKKKYANEIVGYNSRLDTLQAAILRVKLPHVNEWNTMRKKVAARYQEGLSHLPEIELPQLTDDHVFHQYTIRVKNQRRDAIRHALAERGIGTMVYYPTPVHLLPIYQEQGLHLPQAEVAAGEVLSLPIWPYLSIEQQDYVIVALAETLVSLS